MPEPRIVETRPQRGWGRGLVVLAVVVAAAVGVGYLIQTPAQSGDITAVSVTQPLAEPIVAGTKAPEFTAMTTDGRQLSLESLRGKPVWLTFGATWCAPCRVEAPDIEAASVEYADDVEVVALYLSEDQATVAGFAKNLGLTYNQVPDTDTKVSAAYGVRGIPAHYFIDADGVVQAVQVGIVNPATIKDRITSLR